MSKSPHMYLSASIWLRNPLSEHTVSNALPPAGNTSRLTGVRNAATARHITSSNADFRLLLTRRTGMLVSGQQSGPFKMRPAVRSSKSPGTCCHSGEQPSRWRRGLGRELRPGLSSERSTPETHPVAQVLPRPLPPT